MFKPIGQLAASVTSERAPDAEESGIKRVFMVMHGYYGNLFLSKFASGNTDGGEDQGIANARKVWAYGLRDYDTDTIKAALRRCQQHHPEFPPSLPQFLAICAAAKPRETYKPPAPPALTMSQELRDDYLRAHREKAQAAVDKLKAEQDGVSGLDLLKQAIANAVATAGGDEAATLRRLDLMLAPRAAA